MYDLKAYAVRKNGVIEVTLSGSLANSCYQASIADFYPGGNIVYIQDPGSAQVFIDESLKPGSQICLMMLVPWVAHLKIPDTSHNTVTIFVNGDNVQSVPIVAEATEFRVIALSISQGPKHVGCSIIPADAFYPAIYTSVFGPATKSESEAWLSQNCSRPSA